MAYGDSTGANWRQLRGTITGATDFSGRSSRTEVVYYWVAGGLIGLVLNFAVSAVAPFETSLVLGVVLQLVVVVPMFALFVRRLHDQDRSGWWGLLLPLSVLMSIPRLLIQVRGDVAAMIAQRTTPMSIAASLVAVATLVLFLWPGTDGSNRYGHDPRLDDA